MQSMLVHDIKTYMQTVQIYLEQLVGFSPNLFEMLPNAVKLERETKVPLSIVFECF